jgi:hypothetical protein
MNRGNALESREACRAMLEVFAAVAASALLAGCGGQRQPDGLMEMHDSGSVATLTVLAGSSHARTLELRGPFAVIQDESDASGPYFQHITAALQLSDKRILVADGGARRLYMFDSTGLFIRSFSGQGRGPDELEKLSAISVVDGDTVVIYDANQRILKFFDANTGFVRSRRLPHSENGLVPAAVWCITPDRFVRYSRRQRNLDEQPNEGAGIRRWPWTAVLELLDSRGRSLARPIEFSGGYTGAWVGVGDVRAPFAPRAVVSVSHHALIYGSGQNFDLTEVDSAFHRRLEIRWPSMRQAIEPSEVHRVRRAYFGSKLSGQSKRLADVMFGKAMMPKSRPAVGGAFLDDEGRLWATPFQPTPFNDQERDWYVLDPRRESVLHLHIPERWQAHVAAVGHGHILLIRRNNVDVPSIALFDMGEN